MPHGCSLIFRLLITLNALNCSTYYNHYRESRYGSYTDRRYGQPDLQTNGASALYTATENGELEVTKSILENGMPVYVLSSC